MIVWEVQKNCLILGCFSKPILLQNQIQIHFLLNFYFCSLFLYKVFISMSIIQRKIKNYTKYKIMTHRWRRSQAYSKEYFSLIFHILISCPEYFFASLLYFSASCGFFSTPSPVAHILLMLAQAHGCIMLQLFCESSKALDKSFGIPSFPVR